MSATHCILLTGAPDGSALTWDEQHLLSTFEGRIERFLATDSLSSVLAYDLPDSSFHHAKWRSLALDSAGEQKQAWLQQDDLYDGRSQDRTTTSPLDGDFVEHSFAILDGLDESRIITTQPGNTAEHDASTSISFATTTTSLDDTSLGEDDIHIFLTNNNNNAATSTTHQHQTLLTTPLTDVKHLPDAKHITRIHPQTMTVNLLVGIISISPARTVSLRRPRRHNARMEIVEIVVGDDTRAGFSVSFWLSPIDPNRNHSNNESNDAKPTDSDELRHSLRALSPGRVVLLQNVALSTFRGTVYGQSLSRRFARNRTGVTVFDDNAGSNAVAGGVSASAASLSKLQRVREWTNDFVGAVESIPIGGGGGGGYAKQAMKERDALPPDTQD